MNYFTFDPEQRAYITETNEMIEAMYSPHATRNHMAERKYGDMYHNSSLRSNFFDEKNQPHELSQKIQYVDYFN